MLIKQISVFAENRHGAMRDITKVMFESGVNIRAITIADTSDFGVVRLIVDDNDLALKAFRENNMTVALTDVIALAVDDEPGAFYKALSALNDSGIMVEYCYGFVSPIRDGATIILKCDDKEKAIGSLTSKGFKILCREEIL